MNIAAIDHQATKEYVYPEGKHKLIFKLKTEQRDWKNCFLIYWNRYDKEKTQRHIKMHRCYRDQYHDYFYIEVDFQQVACYIKYYFELISSQGKAVWYGSYGPSAQEETTGCFEFLYANESDGYVAPEWAGNQIYYQIFPERFKNGDSVCSRPDLVPWGSPPTRDNYMGGNIKGITEKLDYIKDLGATCLYLNPIFKGTSNHKYDTENYFEVDPDFGTKQDLENLIQQCHERGMRVILDGVFNHCGFYFPPFQDVVKNGENSRYKDWFFIDGLPVQTEPPNYECVGFFKWMPKLNLANPETRDYFLNVGKYWIEEMHTDGWRLDVSDEVEGAFWECFRKEIKGNCPDTILIGEAWSDASKLVQGNRLDSAMNYLFKDIVTDWIAKERIDTSTFDWRINFMLSRYSAPTMRIMYNLLDSHDTSRFLFDCGSNVEKLKLAVAFMMTFPGCPAVYYGDEIGMSGDNDPGCRGAMEWTPEKQNLSLKDWYKKLIQIRKSSPLFTKGSFATNLCDNKNGIFGYIRSFENQNAYIVLNRSSRIQEVFVPVREKDSQFTDMLTGETICTQRPERTNILYNSAITEYKGIILTSISAYSVKIFLNKESGECNDK